MSNDAKPIDPKAPGSSSLPYHTAETEKIAAEREAALKAKASDGKAK